MSGDIVIKNGIKIPVKDGFVWLESDFEFPRQIIESPTGPEAMFERHKDQFNRFFNVRTFFVFYKISSFSVSQLISNEFYFLKYLKIALIFSNHTFSTPFLFFFHFRKVLLIITKE